MITARAAKLNDAVTRIESIDTTHIVKQKLLDMIASLRTEGRDNEAESFINTTEAITDVLGWIERGIDDVYLTRIMDMLARENLSAAALSKANEELAGFYKTGNDVKDHYAEIWQEEFTMSADEYDMPLYERIESAIKRARERIDCRDGNDYIMLKELVSYISGKFDYSGYKNTFGRCSEECEAVVSNINFTLSNLAKPDNEKLTTYKSGKLWLDTLGSKISAHGGQIIKTGDTYYWYGEDNKISYSLTTGVSCYSSKDLKNWKYEGLAFKAFDDNTKQKKFTNEFMTDSLLGTQGRIERPKVIYNEKNNNYVMWMHLEKGGDYSLSIAGVATSDSPTGPFTWQWYGRPVYDDYVMAHESYSQTFRDMNLLKDKDGKAYVFYSSEDNHVMYAVQLNDDYTWINDSGLSSVGSAIENLESDTSVTENTDKILTPDMTRITSASNTYGKTSFTRYQLASGGAIVTKTSKDENGDMVYVGLRNDNRLYSPEYPDTGRWARVGQNAADENRDEALTKSATDNSCCNRREAPAPIEVSGKYYLVTSALSGWKANPSLTQTADSVLGVWTCAGNPATGSGPSNNGQWSQNADTRTTFNSQSTCIIKLPNGEYMYMGDRWNNGVYEASTALGTFPKVDVKASTYVWLPITFEADTAYGDNTLKIRWYDSWSYDALF